MGRVNVHKDFWDCSRGQGEKLANSSPPSLVTIPEVRFCGKGRFPFDRTGRPDDCSTCQFENEIGFFQEFLLEDLLLRAYYSGFD